MPAPTADDSCRVVALAVLFTDVEGSTALWERHPEAMRAALARHDALLRRAVGEHGGKVFKTAGDAFCAAFPAGASAAAAAALAAQRALAADGFAEVGGRLKVRMALDAGEAEARDGDYFGRPLNKAARLLAAAHGGQVLVSAAAARSLSRGLPQKATLNDLGRHRLRDLACPEQVHQLAGPGLASAFPPLRLPAMTDRIELPGATVDFRLEEVRDGSGARIELRSRSFTVLRHLASRAGELVTKDELLAECWPGVVVTEDSLTQCVSEIRRALGEGGRDLIRTVPRRGYALVLPREAPQAPASAPPVAEPPRSASSYRFSIAVLPFDEFGADAGQGPLGAGFAEDITTELARNRELTVIARQSSFVAKAQGKTPAEIAQMLQVRYVLEGSIRRIGERMVVNAQLIDGCDSHHVWAERYSFSAAEVFTVQDELVARIAGTLFSEMREGEKAASLRRPPAALDVYELTVRALARGQQLSREGMAGIGALFDRAVALDPHYAPAHVYFGFGLAADAGMAISGTAGPDALPRAIGMIRRGIELDPTLARGYQALGYALFLSGQFDEALMAAERSAALGPSDAEVLAFLGIAQVGVCQYAAALDSIERAIALNPLAPALYQGIAATALYALDRFEQASRFAMVAAERSPGYTGAYTIGAAADVALGRTDDARARIAALLHHSPGFTMQSPRVAVAYARDPPLRARFVQHLREAGLPDGAGAP